MDWLRRSRSRGVSLALVLVGIAWLVLGLLVVPGIIEQAYRGESLALLNRVIAPYRSLPLERFLDEWRGIALVGPAACFALAAFYYWLRSRPAARTVGTCTPGTLGAIRMLVCGVLLASTLWEDLASSAVLPRSMVRSMGVIDLLYLLPGFEQFVLSPLALGLFQWTLAVVLFAGMVGWKTRWALPLGAVGYLVMAGLLRHYAWFYHTGLLPLYLLAVLSLLPAGDGWSVDRILRIGRGQPVPDANRPTARYGWARYAVWTVLALPYVAAGLSKLRLRGVEWLEPNSFRHILFDSTLRPMEFDVSLALHLTSSPDVVFSLLALSALAGEVLYGLVLFFRWARWVFPPMMAGMHVGILLLQNILFFDLIVLQLVFADVRGLREKVGRYLAARRGRIRLVVPPSERAARQARVLDALDPFDRLRHVKGAPGSSWHATRGDATYRGPELVRLLARALPVLWVAVPLLSLPGVPTRAVRLASRALVPPAPAASPPAAHSTSEVTSRQEARPAVAAGRRDPGWEQPLSGERPPSDERPRPSSQAGSWPSFGAQRLTFAIATVLLLCWAVRVELYPLTAMQMFTSERPETVTYETVRARLRSGEEIRLPIRQCIGAMADSRYRRVLKATFAEPPADDFERLSEICVRRWNRVHPLERHVVQVTVEQRRWDFVRHPEDPQHGQRIGRRVLPSDSTTYTDDRAGATD